MKGTGELLLYLDFDGVLHHENVLWHSRVGAYLSAPDCYVLFQHAELLEKTLEPYPQVQIVLSTSWVSRYGRTKAAKNLRPALRSRVIGATFRPRMNPDEFAMLPRCMQVWQDVQRRKPRAWLALDDNVEGWPVEHAAHVVRTHKHAGLGNPAVLVEFQLKLQEIFR